MDAREYFRYIDDVVENRSTVAGVKGCRRQATLRAAEGGRRQSPGAQPAVQILQSRLADLQHFHRDVGEYRVSDVLAAQKRHGEAAGATADLDRIAKRRGHRGPAVRAIPS
jgi:hypothetical protein